MRVILSLPAGNSLEFDVESSCTLNQLRTIIQQHEGIPEELQNYNALSTAKQGNWETFSLIELFPQDYNEDKNTLDLKLMLGLEGGLGECDLCLCGCTCCHAGKCYVWVSELSSTIILNLIFFNYTVMWIFRLWMCGRLFKSCLYVLLL